MILRIIRMIFLISWRLRASQIEKALAHSLGDHHRGGALGVAGDHAAPAAARGSRRPGRGFGAFMPDSRAWTFVGHPLELLGQRLDIRLRARRASFEWPPERASAAKVWATKQFAADRKLSSGLAGRSPPPLACSTTPLPLADPKRKLRPWGRARSMSRGFNKGLGRGLGGELAAAAANHSSAVDSSTVHPHIVPSSSHGVTGCGSGQAARAAAAGDAPAGRGAA